MQPVFIRRTATGDSVSQEQFLLLEGDSPFISINFHTPVTEGESRYVVLERATSVKITRPVVETYTTKAKLPKSTAVQGPDGKVISSDSLAHKDMYKVVTEEVVEERLLYIDDPSLFDELHTYCKSRVYGG